MEKEFAALYPIMTVEQDCILSKLGDMTLAFRAELPEGFTLSDEDYETLHQGLIKAVRLLEPGTVLHKQDWFVRATYQPEADPNDSWLNACSKRYFTGRTYLEHECYILLTKKPARRKIATSLATGLLGTGIVHPELLNPQTLTEFKAVAMRFQRLLEDTKLIKLTALRTDDLLSSKSKTGLIERYCFLNGKAGHPQIKDITFGDTIGVGQQQLAVYSLADASDLPASCGPRIDYDQYSTDKTRFPISFTANLGLLIDCNHIYNQFIIVGDGQATLKLMEKKRLRLQSLSAYSRANAIALEATNSFLNEAISQQRLPVKAHFNVMAWAESAEELKALRNQVASGFAAIDATAKPETIGAPQLWWSAIPGNAAELPANDTFDTFAEQACCFFNLETNYRSDPPENGIRFCDRLSSRPVFVDLFDAPRASGIASNMGMLICGTSGGGKSVTANHILRSLFDQQAHCLTIDIGGSYRGLCEETGGYYFTYTQEKPISFNPFYIADGDYLDTEKNESLKELLRSLWKAEDESVKRSEYVALSNALQGYYAYLRNDSAIFPCFDTFYEYVKNSYVAELQSHEVDKGMFDVHNFLYVLRPFYKGGEFDFLLNARENLDLLSQPFMVIELDNIKDHPILFPVVTLVIMETFISKIRKLGAARKVFMIDEAWKAISKTGMAHFAQYAFKTIRKFNGIPIVSTQELDDLISNTVIKDAIINNADIKILMDMKKFLHKFDKLQDTLGLSQKAKTILLSVNKNDREIFIDIGGQVQKVYRNELCPEEYYTYTTEGKERVRVLEYTKKFGSVRKGIEAIIKEKEGK